MTSLIILPTVALGGVEKRLTGLFLELKRRGEDVRLVASEELVRALQVTPDCRRIEQYASALDTFRAGFDVFSSLRTKMIPLFREYPHAVYHYALVSPLRLHRSTSKRTLYTIPNATLAQYNVRGLVDVYGGVARASRVDVLDPQVCKQLSSRFWWRRGSISLTPGSFVDLDLFRPQAEKRQRIVFCGLFSDEKQAPRLVSTLPAFLRKLHEAGLEDTELIMMGRDPEGGSVTRDVAALGDPRVRAFHSARPGDILASALVFLSLQRTTNHPSKALLEAMACGAAPVVTDTRDSRLSAPDDLASYVPRDFTAEDLARACIPLLRRTVAEARSHGERMRDHLSTRFTLSAMTDYYHEQYTQLRHL